MSSPFNLVLHFSWIVLLLLAMIFKLRCIKLTKILSNEYQVNIKKNLPGSSISIRELTILHDAISPKEIKHLLMKLIDAKIWLYTLLTAAAIVFTISNFF